MLELSGLDLFYGEKCAAREVSLHVPEGQIVGLIGANGAGKSTVLKAVCGLLRCRRGSIKFLGRSIENAPSHVIVRMGMACVPEGRHLFKGLNVADNLRMGSYFRRDSAAIRQDLQLIYDLFPILYSRRSQESSSLSGGEQGMLALGRALMSRPRLLMLDEPSLGLAPLVVETLFKVIKDINATGTTILLVEQNARQALEVSHLLYLMENGRVVLGGAPEALKADERVKRAYLGG